MPKSVYADAAAILVTARCPEPHLLPCCLACPLDTSPSGSASFSLGNTSCSAFSLDNGRRTELKPVVFPLQQAVLLSPPRRSGAALQNSDSDLTVTQNQGSTGRPFRPFPHTVGNWQCAGLYDSLTSSWTRPCATETWTRRPPTVPPNLSHAVTLNGCYQAAFSDSHRHTIFRSLTGTKWSTHSRSKWREVHSELPFHNTYTDILSTTPSWWNKLMWLAHWLLKNHQDNRRLSSGFLIKESE